VFQGHLAAVTHRQQVTYHGLSSISLVEHDSFSCNFIVLDTDVILASVIICLFTYSELIGLCHTADNRLQAKHPPASGGLDESPDISQIQYCPTLKTMYTIQLADSSGGPDGMRTQHAKYLVFYRYFGADFLKA